jgi:DNA-binding LytR/AlgR family response regulator
MVTTGILMPEICYLQADNNSTDIHLNGGEMITAFKTLKHFEGVLSYPFVRIHNSYIVNSRYISDPYRKCSLLYQKHYGENSFSKSYKVNVDLIISEISNGNT